MPYLCRQELENSSTLDDYNISKEATLYLILKIEVYVEIPSTKMITLELKSSDTIKDVKDKIHVKEEIPPDRQSLMCDAEQLEDSRTVTDSVQSSKPIYLALGLQ